MSLSALNYPPLVALAGITSITSLLPHLENLVADGTIPWATLKLINVAVYGVNAISVSIPGRIDGEEAEALVAEKKTGRVIKRSEEAQAISSEKGRSLVTPSGWAFAIWGPIFTGELIFSVAQLSLSESSSPLTTLLKDISPAVIVAQTTQSLWCAAFRPKYKGQLMYISSGLLASAAHSLSKAHAIYAAASPSSYSLSEYGTFFLPLSLHFGWLTAATFVNLNGAVAMNQSISSKTVARVGHVSVVAATAVGVFVTVTRSAPVFGGVIAWALLAVADGMAKRMRAKTKKSDGDGGGDEGVAMQRGLATVGALVSLGSSVYVALLRE